MQSRPTKVTNLIQTRPLEETGNGEHYKTVAAGHEYNQLPNGTHVSFEGGRLVTTMRDQEFLNLLVLVLKIANSQSLASLGGIPLKWRRSTLLCCQMWLKIFRCYRLKLILNLKSKFNRFLKSRLLSEPELTKKCT